MGIPASGPIDQAELERLLHFLGLDIHGDLGGYTIYCTRRGRMVMYPVQIPQKPPSPAQQKMRARFGMAQANWKLRPAQEKATWEILTYKASLCMTGQNVFIALSLVPDNTRLDTWNRKYNLSLPYPTYVGY